MKAKDRAGIDRSLDYARRFLDPAEGPTPAKSSPGPAVEGATQKLGGFLGGR